METLALDSQKIRFVKTFLNERDESILKKVMAYFEKEKTAVETPPCQFTIQELRTEVIESLKDFENGDYVTLERMREKHPRL
jgi:hypothetical protein